MLKRGKTRNGMGAARQQGRIGGRRSKLKADQKKEILKMIKKDKMTAASVARLFNMHPATISRIMQ